MPIRCVLNIMMDRVCSKGLASRVGLEVRVFNKKPQTTNWQGLHRFEGCHQPIVGVNTNNGNLKSQIFL